MKIIIAEDETTASRKLESILAKLDPNIKVAAVLESVKEVLAWVKNNPSPDLGFFDIQLADDTSFRVFEEWKIDFPVVFVTAYDDYLLKAFEYNSIHYLLKPVTEQKINQVLVKLKRLEGHFISHGIARIFDQNSLKIAMPQRIIVRKGMDMCPIETKDIAYFFTEHKISFVKTFDNSLFIFDQPLSELEGLVEPNLFFRANRQYVINIASVVRYRTVGHSKLQLDLHPRPKGDVIVAKERSGAFKTWIRGIYDPNKQ